MSENKDFKIIYYSAENQCYQRREVPWVNLVMPPVVIRIISVWKVELGQVVQSIVSLMSSLVVKMLTVLVSTMSNSQILLLKKYE